MNAEAIGRKLREARGFDRSQADVAAAVGVSPAAISQYERGERIPEDRIKLALAEYFGMTVQDLFFTAE